MRLLRRFAPLFLLVALVPGCRSGNTSLRAVRFENLGDYHRTITTSSPEAQAWFDQGLALYWGFYHDAAIASFREAVRHDPRCAMAFWGVALASGPHINNMLMAEEASQVAFSALREAQLLADGCTPLEKELIGALASRYAEEPPADRRPLDEAWADAMRGVWRAHPDDPDVGALCAEAVMNLRPWDLWSPDGEPRPETPEVLATIGRVLELSPRHPGANHFAVHAWEASREPERALEPAERLRSLVPDSGHLVHMPSHIDIRLGRYDEAIAANQRAIAAEERYIDKVGREGFQALYRAHNFHFLAYAAMFDGRRDIAMGAARGMLGQIPLEVVRQMPDLLDGFLATPVHVMVRFGLWEDLLREPTPPTDLPVTTAFWRYGRAVALAATGRVEESAAEREALEAACARVPESAYIGNNPARVVLDVARPFAEGELEYRRGNVERAFELLRTAVARDDALLYDEPWGWMEPVRHALGALLLEQGRVAEAEAVYREDLARHPDNGWSLHGLAECLRRTDRPAEAAQAQAQFQAVWAEADIAIRGSCYCRTRS